MPTPLKTRSLRKALNLAVDGTDLDVIRKTMELEISLEEHHGEAEAKVFEAAGGYAPTIGIIGAVLGLIQVMKNLANIEEVGHGIAVAFVATVYGVGTANIFFLPAGNKLKARMQKVIQNRELVLEGVAGIVEAPEIPSLILPASWRHTRRQEPRPRKPAKEPRGARSRRRRCCDGRRIVHIPMARAKKQAAPENHERWLVSYADFITLLFAFFVVMFASSQTDKSKAKQVSDAVKDALENGGVSSAVREILGGTVDERGKGNLLR